MSRVKILFQYLLLVFVVLAVNVNAYCQNDSLALVLDSFILSEMQQQAIPGLAASIIVDDQVVWKNVYGTANYGNNTLVSFDTQFTLASISKLFTSLACVQLWEAGVLDIDADINNYLPITIVNPNFPEAPITTRQLLQHKSSLKDFESDLQLWDNIGDPEISLDQFCSNYFVQGGDFYLASNWNSTAPGSSDYWYSNAGFTLLGYLVESVSGQAFNEYVVEHIFEPLEMENTAWFYDETDSTQMAMPYNSVLEPFGYYSVPEYPAAMMKSSIDELSNFLVAIIQKGEFNGVELISPASFETMIPMNMENGFGWWGKDTWYGDSNGDFWSHGGFMNGVRTQLNYYPEESQGLIILTNGEGSYAAIQNKMEELLPLFEMGNLSGVGDLERELEVSIRVDSSAKTLLISLADVEADRFEVFDLAGRLVLEGKIDGPETIVIGTENLKGICIFNLLKGKEMLYSEKLSFEGY